MARHFSTALGILLEAVLVAMVACAFGFAANQLSGRGLNLGRNYFPSGTNTIMAAPRIAAPIATATNSANNTNEEIPDVDQRLKDKGLQPISLAEVKRLFHNPGYRQGEIIFVDARNEEEYNDGHIPGAWQLNPYHPERELSDVQPRCLAARQVVVYCTGGECEDADSTALFLRDQAGVPPKKIVVYGGGYDQWSSEHLPIERGPRDSGQIFQQK